MFLSICLLGAGRSQNIKNIKLPPNVIINKKTINLFKIIFYTICNNFMIYNYYINNIISIYNFF